MNEHSAPFVANSELAHTLKQEISNISPETQAKIEDFTQLIQSKFLDMFGQYFQKEKIEKNKHLASRVTITDSETFNVMHSQWSTKKSPIENGISANRAFTTEEGGIIVLNDPKDSWHFLTEDIQHQLIVSNGNIDLAKKAIATTFLLHQLTHEIIHRYQDSKSPVAFLECGTRYYQAILAKDLFGIVIVDKLDDKRIAFYKKLLDEIGPKVHNVFFGTEEDKDKYFNVIFKMDKQTEKLLFPDTKRVTQS